MGRAAARAFVLVVIASLSSGAYEHPLTSRSVWDAWFLARTTGDQPVAFLAQYLRRLPLPKTGPYVAEIELRTPLAQVVLHARQALDGSNPLRLEQEYRSQPDRILLRVRIDTTPTYVPSLVQTVPGLGPADFWRDFPIRLLQKKRPLQPTNVRGMPIYSFDVLGGSALLGAEVELEFDAEQVASAPATVEVLTPDGQRIAVVFDLEKLR